MSQAQRKVDHEYGMADDQTVVSYAPIVLPPRDRGSALQVRISAPATGGSIPIIVFSHGNGQSFRAYGPLVDYWASNGFAVIQPTHIESRTLGVAPDDPRRPDMWRHREEDLVAILDGLARIEDAAPAIKGRLDHSKIAVAGHSWGAQTASMLLGATHPDPRDGSLVKIKDDRVKAGVLLAIPGTGGGNLSAFAAANFPFMQPDFSDMTTPALIVAGDQDNGAMTVRGPDWWREAYDLSPGRKALFTVSGGEHSLGGIPGYEVKETTDESASRVAAIQVLSTGFIRSVLGVGAEDWTGTRTGLFSATSSEGILEEK